MSCKLSRRNFASGRKVKLLQRQPLPEPADSTDCAGSTDGLESDPTSQSPASRSDKEDDFSWHYSSCESSLLGQSSSSFMSWADEVEAETTQKMQQLMDGIDRSLYCEEPADESVRPEQLQECKEWREKFPHLRVVGRGLPTERDCDGAAGVLVPTETEEVIASHGCCEDDGPSSPCLSVSRHGSGQGGDAAWRKTLQSMRGEVCAYVWSEVAKRLSEQTLPKTRGANQDSPASRAGSSGRKSLATGQRACSLQRRLPPAGTADARSARNLPSLVARCAAAPDLGQSSGSGRWSRHGTLPPIENMQVSNKVMPFGRESPGLFGEKLNDFTEHSIVDGMRLVEPRVDWRHRATSGGEFVG
ncbi:uncharacterized protein LOC134528374 isoform X2 [Bacillus rossius redtenbacheri]|uniref:uncharacterized protein LOC134528374 isoform X2 n=1 Tax=Bacillus rossius redtenbacheri TaxID=93214 RepID=UPI002FDECF0E